MGMKYWLAAGFLALSLFLIGRPADAEPFPYGDILSPEKCFYETTIGADKKPYADIFNEYEMFLRKGKKFHRALVAINYPGFKKVTDDIVLGNDGKVFYAVFYLRSTEDKDGKLVRLEEVAFNRAEKKVRIVREELNPNFKEQYETSGNIDITMDAPDDSYAPLMLDIGYRVGSLGVGYKTSCHMISRQGMLCLLNVAVDKIVNIETPMKTFPCFQISQTPHNLYMKHLKFFISAPESVMPKITFYYSVEQPHRLIRYYGYKDFGPASLKLSQAGLLFQDYMDVRIKNIVPLEIDELAATKLLFERMDKYNLTGSN